MQQNCFGECVLFPFPKVVTVIAQGMDPDVKNPGVLITFPVHIPPETTAFRKGLKFIVDPHSGQGYFFSFFDASHPNTDFKLSFALR